MSELNKVHIEAEAAALAMADKATLELDDANSQLAALQHRATTAEAEDSKQSAKHNTAVKQLAIVFIYCMKWLSYVWWWLSMAELRVVVAVSGLATCGGGCQCVSYVWRWLSVGVQWLSCVCWADGRAAEAAINSCRKSVGNLQSSRAAGEKHRRGI